MERWIMNRLGFVNFWVYDIEDFPFKDGKLLLRGSNGSGKSITTQSFIPYILDGDRQPSRLDPFGSKDRKMEYYLLGDSENEKEESTGYLFLEFKKPISGQYRTIGIGLQAKKNSKMSTWGFCILDNRRVGIDLFLYKEIGNEIIPYAAKQLKEILGDNNLFVEKTSEYKAMVAKQIFEIDSDHISDYDQLTNILIKTRSSKLASKENLKPDELYRILNDSLQTLSDDELRPMAEAMTKIDETHKRIEDAQNVLREIKQISAEYDKYNRYMLWKKADKYQKKHEETNQICNEVDKYEEKTSSNNEAKATAKDNLQTAKIKMDDLKRELSLLNVNDIQNYSKKKTEAECKLTIEKNKKEKKASYISSKKETLAKRQNELRDKSYEKDSISYDITKMVNELNEYAEFVPPLHNKYMRNIKVDDRFFDESQQCRNEISNYNQKLRDILGLIQKRDMINNSLCTAEKRYDDEKNNVFNKEKSVQTAQNLFDEQRDAIIEKLHTAAKKYKEFVIDEILLSKFERIICNYEDQNSAAELIKITSAHYTQLINKSNESISLLKSKCELAQNNYNEVSEKLDKLKKSSESSPDRTEKRETARHILKEKNIMYCPLYKCIDFKNEISDEQKAVIESELADMGVLDALVVSKSDYNVVYKEIGELSDCLLIAEDVDNSDNPFFNVTVEGTLFDTACTVINTLCNSNGVATKISLDGYYRNGIISGHSMKETSSRFIGSESRRKYREKQIAELEEEYSKTLSIYEQAKAKIKEEAARQQTLKIEYDNLPSTDDITQALVLLTNAQGDFRTANSALDNANLEYERIKKQYDNSCSELEISSSDIPYRKNENSYKEAINAIENYSNDLQSIISLLRSKYECIQNINRITDEIDDLDNDVADAESELKSIEMILHECKETIRLSDEFLQRPENVDAAKQVTFLNTEINKEQQTIEESNTKISKCESENGVYSKELTKVKEKLISCIEEENILSNFFNEEYELGLVITDMSLLLNQRADLAIKSVSSGDSEKELVSIQTRLNDTFHKHAGTAAAEYNPRLSDDCFEEGGPDSIRKRSIITLSWQNKALTPNQFQNVLSEAIENDKLLVKKEEEKMFTEILMDTISKKLYNRINESKKWIDYIAKLMENINTSMGLSFSLTWKPKNDNDGNQMKIDELCNILNKDRAIIRSEDYEKLSSHFRSKIKSEQLILEEKGLDVNYYELVKNVLDYRNWYQFRLLSKNSDGTKFNELTLRRFNTFSGGERALSLYIPLFAAVAAQYKKTGSQAPMILALDEAFAGVDDSNISEMFGLLEKLGFGYIVNSQALWGCYETVPGLEIAELFHDKDTDFITVILYEWNGKRKTLVT